MSIRHILNADLYENLLTEKQGDYTAKPRITGTARNSDVADAIVSERTEYRKETIEHILRLADQKKIEILASGKSLIDGMGQYILAISGCFGGESPKFDREKHKVNVTYTVGKTLADALDEVDFNVQKASTGPVINHITDVRTQTVDQQLTPGKAAIISGVRLLIKGDSPNNGVFFTRDAAGATPVKVEFFSRATTSELIVEIPELPEGDYRVSVTTQAGAGYKTVKEPRTYTFPILLTVGKVGTGEGSEDL